MLQIRHKFLGFWLAVFLPVLVSAQSAQYSVLCNLTQTFKKTAEPAAAGKFDVAVVGHKVSNIGVRLIQGPRRIMVLQDISRSMNNSNAQKISFQAVKDFVESSPPTDQLALVDFNIDVHIDIDLKNVDEFSKELSDPNLSAKLKPTGRTALFDAVAASVASLQRNPQEGDSILVISDGGDNSSKINAEKLREHLLSSKIRLYLLILTGDTPTPNELASSFNFLRLVIDTGGTFVGNNPLNKLLPNGPIAPGYDASPKSPADVREGIKNLHNLIEKGYKVEFDLDPRLTKSTQMNVLPVNQDGKPIEGLQLLCPKYISPN